MAEIEKATSHEGPSSKGKKLTPMIAVASVLCVGLTLSVMVLGIKVSELRKQQSDSEAESIKSNLNSVTEDICNTPECVIAAGDMLKAMDQTANPCDDFYKFSCGGWLKRNPIPDTASSWSQFNILRESLTRDIRDILERDLDGNEPSPVTLAKQFYASCIGQNNTDDHSDLKLFIDDLTKDTNVHQLGQKLGRIRGEISLNLLITMNVNLDEQSTENYTIYIDQANLGLNQAFLTPEPEHPNKEAYRTMISDAWSYVFPESDGNQSQDVARRVVEFETKLAKISTKPEDRRNRTQLYNPMSIAELKKLTAFDSIIEWDTYMVESFKKVEGADRALQPISELRVIVRDLDYYRQLGGLLSNQISENPITILNYLQWRIIYGFINEVSDKLRDVYFQYVRTTQGASFPSPRWQMCSERTNTYLGMAISHIYVQELFDAGFKDQIDEMIGNLREAFLNILNEIEWIATEETREKAREKANKISSFIGYPEWLVDPVRNHQPLIDYYQNLSLSTSDDHFRNIFDVVTWRNEDSLLNILRRKDNTKWITDPTVVNAFYSSTYNSISFPAGILQSPFYFTGKPIQALNYAAIGMVMGHEITHGFDDRGRQSDGDGNLVDWWDDETVRRYVDKASCFIDQYSGYVAEEVGLNLNGNNTLGENIADNGGIRQAFRAYQSYVRDNGVEAKLPGLDYTPEQLFFIAFSQIWCGAYTPQGMESQILTGVHSPVRFRVKGPLSNSDDFANVWNCPLPDPEEKCQIW